MPGEKPRHRQTDDKQPDESNPALEKFENLTRKLLGVSKGEVDEQRTHRERGKERKDEKREREKEREKKRAG